MSQEPASSLDSIINHATGWMGQMPYRMRQYVLLRRKVQKEVVWRGVETATQRFWHRMITRGIRNKLGDICEDRMVRESRRAHRWHIEIGCDLKPCPNLLRLVANLGGEGRAEGGTGVQLCCDTWV